MRPRANGLATNRAWSTEATSRIGRNVCFRSDRGETLPVTPTVGVAWACTSLVDGGPGANRGRHTFTRRAPSLAVCALRVRAARAWSIRRAVGRAPSRAREVPRVRAPADILTAWASVVTLEHSHRDDDQPFSPKRLAAGYSSRSRSARTCRRTATARSDPSPRRGSGTAWRATGARRATRPSALAHPRSGRSTRRRRSARSPA